LAVAGRPPARKECESDHDKTDRDSLPFPAPAGEPKICSATEPSLAIERIDPVDLHEQSEFTPRPYSGPCRHFGLWSRWYRSGVAACSGPTGNGSVGEVRAGLELGYELPPMRLMSTSLVMP
jgi:hypothetical protein